MKVFELLLLYEIWSPVNQIVFYKIIRSIGWYPSCKYCYCVISTVVLHFGTKFITLDLYGDAGQTYKIFYIFRIC